MHYKYEHLVRTMLFHIRPEGIKKTVNPVRTHSHRKGQLPFFVADKQGFSLIKSFRAEAGIKCIKTGYFEYTRFIYYKISKRVSWVLPKVKLKLKTPFARDTVVNNG